MSIIIQRLKEKFDTKMLAEILHSEEEFVALVSGSAESLQAHLGSECLVELGYEKVIEWKVIPDFQDEMSGIAGCSSQPNFTTVKGRVHHVMEMGDNQSVIDLYIQTGPEFMTVASGELGDETPVLGSGIEITVENLCFYPTNT